MGARLSVCLLIRNEEKYLFRCLSSVKNVADEIIVVDTGSTDNSLEIAGRFTGHIYTFEWCDDFSAARNFALEKASGEWVLVLDGDEELDADSEKSLRNKIDNGGAEAYLIKVINYYENGNELLSAPDVILRLFRNNKEYRYTGIIHEQVINSILSYNPEAKIEIAEDICIFHYGYMKEPLESKEKLKRNMGLLLKAAAGDPDNILNRYHLGIEYYRAREFEKALDHFLFAYSRADLRAVYVPKLMRNTALCYYFLGRPEDALMFIDNEWAKVFPDQGDLFYLKGVICRDLGYYYQAYEAFKRSLSVPAQPAYYGNVYCQNHYKTYYFLGGLAEYFMDKESALFYYFESLKHNPRMFASLKRMIAILNPRINPEYTVNSLNKVFDLSDPNLQADLALTFYHEGAYQLALDCIERAAGYMPLAENMLLLRGLCLMRSRQYDEAVEQLNFINRDRNMFIEAQQNLLLFFWLQKNKKAAGECLEKMKKAGADLTLLEILTLLVKGVAGDLKRAAEVTDHEKSIVKDIMDLLVELGDSSSIDEAWQNLTAIAGNRPSNLLAELFFKYEKYDLAEKEFRHLLEVGNTDAWTVYYLGKTCWARGDLKAAEKCLRQAMDKGLDIPKLRWETARLYQELAVETLREGLGHCPDNRELLRRLGELENEMIEV